MLIYPILCGGLRRTKTTQVIGAPYKSMYPRKSTKWFQLLFVAKTIMLQQTSCAQHAVDHTKGQLLLVHSAQCFLQ